MSRLLLFALPLTAVVGGVCTLLYKFLDTCVKVEDCHRENEEKLHS